MSKVKLAVIYYSTYGTNHDMAREAEKAARAAGADVRVLRVRETAPEEVVRSQEAWAAQAERTADEPIAGTDDLEWADAYLFSSPTRFGGAASQMRSFIDTVGPLWAEGKLAGKHMSAMTSAQNPNGGQETTLQSLYYTFMHWGGILVAPGYTDDSVFAAGGNPYGVGVTATGTGLTDEDKAAIHHQARRLVEVTARYKKGSEALEPVAAD